MRKLLGLLILAAIAGAAPAHAYQLQGPYTTNAVIDSNESIFSGTLPCFGALALIAYVAGTDSIGSTTRCDSVDFIKWEISTNASIWAAQEQGANVSSGTSVTSLQYAGASMSSIMPTVFPLGAHVLLLSPQAIQSLIGRLPMKFARMRVKGGDQGTFGSRTSRRSHSDFAVTPAKTGVQIQIWILKED